MQLFATNMRTLTLSTRYVVRVWLVRNALLNRCTLDNVYAIARHRKHEMLGIQVNLNKNIISHFTRQVQHADLRAPSVATAHTYTHTHIRYATIVCASETMPVTTQKADALADSC